MNALVERIKQEPVIFQSLIQAIIAAGVSFGLHLTVTQIAAILAVTAIVLGLIARAHVTPNVNVATTVGDK